MRLKYRYAHPKDWAPSIRCADTPEAKGEPAMPRLALISDIHGNLEALEATLDDIERVGADSIVCLGDVVGYGPDPAACVDLVLGRCDVIVRGNHDEALLEPKMQRRFNAHAQTAMDYARSALDTCRVSAIDQWASCTRLAGVELTHGSFGPERFAYVASPGVVRDALEGLSQGQGATIGAVGHTHLPAVYSASAPDAPNERIRALVPPTNAVVTLHEGFLHIVNPGSVGQPRDRNPDASWALLDATADTFRLRRVMYDICAVETKMRRAGLPDVLWERLRVGA